jgi:hypothetical protein
MAAANPRKAAGDPGIDSVLCERDDRVQEILDKSGPRLFTKFLGGPHRSELQDP